MKLTNSIISGLTKNIVPIKSMNFPRINLKPIVQSAKFVFAFLVIAACVTTFRFVTENNICFEIMIETANNITNSIIGIASRC